MTDYSHIIVFFLILPVLMQIIIPLLMLVAFGIVRAVKLVFGQQAAKREQLPETAGQELQLS